MGSKFRFEDLSRGNTRSEDREDVGEERGWDVGYGLRQGNV